MNYQRLYDALISRAQNRPRPEGYVERHHIVPTALNGVNKKFNIVYLTAREHYIAHVLLAKLHKGVMWNALYLMGAKFKRNSSRLYEKAKIEKERFDYSSYGKLGGKIGGKRAKLNSAGIFSPEYDRSKGALASAKLRYRCLECGLVSRPCCIKTHQLYKKHKGVERVA